MVSGLILVKLAVTLAAVLGLSAVAERVSPRLAGILAGFPHGIAIVLFFIAWEQGAAFGRVAAIAAIGGLSANAILALVYAALCRGRGWGAAALAGAGGVAAFLVAAGALRAVSPGPALAVTITGTVLAGAWWLLRRIADVKIAGKPRIGWREGAFRAAIAAGSVLFITGIAGAVGPQWSGLLAGFPVVTFPLLLIIHARHGRAPVATMVKNYPVGLTTLIVYTLAVAAGFEALGAGWGTALGLAAALAWLGGLSALRVRLAGRPAVPPRGPVAGKPPTSAP